jgi:phosphoserine phosphatase RsbX
MSAPVAAGSALLQCGFAATALDGEQSGDLHLVTPLPHGALVAVIDGLGHGPAAAEASRVAARVLREHAGASLVELIELCHAGLRSTRGAVMSLASLDSLRGAVDWCGIGNVEGALFSAAPGRARHAIVCRGGVVGYRLPALKVTTVPLSVQDLLVFATDGISSSFAHVVDVEREPQEIADRILANCGKRSDDALVLVVRYLGVAS